ncbi:O-antigen ligase family protein [Candidatus Azambacteria bacterium]|nr:O-antigen ligase family protein [Candidatus Azambacteria bacterium]
MIDFRKYITSLNLVFFVEVFVIFLAVLGILPREAFLFLLGILLYFILFSPYEDSVLLIARSIPLFAALPITETFDSLNTWRVVVLALFLKWFFDNNFFLFLNAVFTILKKSKESIAGAVKFAYQNWKIEFLAFALFFISLLSLFKADDLTTGIKRMIYFVNLGMLFFVVRSVSQKIGIEKIAKNVLISGIIVAIVGFFQLFLAYLMPINDFSEFWALQADKALYGTAWSEIAIRANTWFAYYNETIHLRMFSSFPDSHSFPLYLLMVLVFTSAIFYKKYSEKKNIKCITAFIALSLFAIILTGTRGIWASFAFPAAILIFWYFKKNISKESLKILALPFIIFLILLPLSAPVFSSKQFRMDSQNTEENSKIFAKRLKSIIDTEEVSNKGRIYIWTETAKSIIKNPFLGVGIGNFPTVLKENISAMKAGASAHNLYLHIPAEIGILGFLIFMTILFEILKKAWIVFKENSDGVVRFFALNAFLFLVWILGYSLTDVAIFDERAFLMLMILLGVLFSIKNEQSAHIN